MPYIIRESIEGDTKGYKVCKKDNTRKCFSKHPLPKERAEKQRTAIILSELSRKSGGASSQQVHSGPRGGKYIIVNGNKRYI